ncbi:hypothetical protein EAH78_18235 [Pseudomonas arsenicoxydans]|uniref:Phage tail collar domain-containing protein n=2 Tax=Pseudomonas arsenicoxydans TaxID=702115 RepID=A0A502HTB2_9PSED|nr:hypothetical protein EAH78_18235 [Pseudomonas arsenicoxydans]
MGANGPLLPDSYTLLHGVRVAFTATHTNNGSATLDIGQTIGTLLGAKPLKRLSGDNLAPNEIIAGASYTATFDGGVSTWFVQVADAIQNQRLDALEAQIAAFSALPIGAPLPWPTPVPPAGYLTLAGQAFNPSIYPLLAQVYPGLVLPNACGLFIRGWDAGRGVDSGRGLLTYQTDTMQNITGGYSQSGNTGVGTSAHGVFAGALGPIAYGEGGIISGYTSMTFDASRVARVSHENRPQNIAFHYICRAL